MKAETWFRGAAAVDAGFADEMVPAKKRKKDSDSPGGRLPTEFFATLFRHLPADLRTALVARPAPADLIRTERDFQNALRSTLGFSGERARAITSHGFKAAAQPRDEGAGGRGGNTPTPGPDPRDEDGQRVSPADQIRTFAATFPSISRS